MIHSATSAFILSSTSDTPQWSQFMFNLECLRLALYSLQVGLILYGVILAIRHYSATKVGSLMERFSAPAFLPVRDTADEFLLSLRSMKPADATMRLQEVCARKGAEDIHRFNRLHALGMFFGEIGEFAKHRIIGAKVLGIFDRLIPYYWHQMTPFIIACHVEFGFPIDSTRALVDQKLSMFSSFQYAYREMLKSGIAKESISHPS